MLNNFKYSFIIVLLIFVSLNSCKKNKSTTVKGTVVDATRSLAGINNATIYLQEKDANLTCFSCLPQTIATYNADALGHFSFSFEGKNGYSYSIVASATNYYSNIGSGDYSSLNNNEKNNIEVPLKPIAWLKLHLKNTIPFDGSDQIGISGDMFGVPQQYYGSSIDSTCFFEVYGNNNINITWGIIKNSIQTNYSGLIFCPSFDTTSYNINY